MTEVVTGQSRQLVSPPWPLAVSMRKFVVMSFFTIGIYDVYWFYWNWRRQRDLAGARISPGWRAFLSPFVAYTLMRDVRDAAVASGINVSWSPALKAAGYFISIMGFLMPGWLWVITLITFLPLIPVQQTINRLHTARSGAGEADGDNGDVPDNRFSFGNIVAMLVGTLVIVAVIAFNILASNGVLDRWEQDLLQQLAPLLQQ
jgi:hypothetical protein